MILVEQSAARKHQIMQDMGKWAESCGPEIVSAILECLPPAVRPALTTLEEIEAGLQSFLHVIGRYLTESFIAARASERSGICRECGVSWRMVEARRARTIFGVFGSYQWERRYDVCPHGQGSDVPEDRALATPRRF